MRNGSFTAAAGDRPAGWSTDLWSRSAGTTFEWKRGEGAPGVVVVRSPKPNDARWIQRVAVKPDTWYRLSGFVRARGVPQDQFGATLAILQGFTHGRPLRGKDTGWQFVSLWFKTEATQRSVRIACRLGEYGKTTRGEAWCTGIELRAQARPPVNADFVYGPTVEATTPVGLPAALAIALLLALGLARWGRLPEEVAIGERLWLDGLLLALLVAKALLAPSFQYRVDVGSYSAWASRLAELGPARFYAPGYFADYPPGYMYVLWAVGSLGHALGLAPGRPAFLVLLKLPAMLADLAVARLLFARLRPGGRRLAWTAALAFALNPALLVDSTVWGQTDSVLALLVLLAYLAQGERLFELAWAFAALAVLTKPQALLLVPLLALWPWGWWRSGRPLSSLLVAVATGYLIADPFRGDRSWRWLYDLYAGTTGYYAETSVNAMNLAALLFGMRGRDDAVFFGLTAQAWGFAIGLAVGLAFLAAYLRRRDRTTFTALLAAAALVSFVCLTRMHERYLYPFFPLAGLLGTGGASGALYWSLSALFLVNELVVYAQQKTATAGPPWLWGSVGAALTLGALAWLALVWRHALARCPSPFPAAAELSRDDEAWERSLEEPPGAAAPRAESEAPRPAALRWTWREGAALAAVLAVALGLRVWRLGSPTDLVFDEVYFVDQARKYLSGEEFMDPHPPVAKLAIAAGIALFGDTPFGWRIVNAITGTALVALVYLLARSLFRRKPAALLAAAMVALDGLCIVDSRIAVIDIHYVTWAVAAYVLAVGAIRARAYGRTWRMVAIGALAGLSVGAKLFIPFFSFLLVVGAIGLGAWNEARRRGLPRFASAARPVVLVGATAFGVYCLSYAPHFLWGWWHSPLDLVKYIGIEVPNYEAAVADATHPYSSKWWSWPLLLRPVWYYWKDPGPLPGTVVGIWGSGNPPLWWAALPALVLAALHAVRERSFPLAFVVAGWILHLAPWIPIGRTLFLYHYLPSLLFAFLALAWLLDRLWAGAGSATERAIAGAAVLGSLLPVAFAVIPGWGPLVFGVLLAGYEALVFARRGDPVRIGRAAVAVFAVAIVALACYFAPIWLGIPIAKQSWQERMWISGSGWMNWV